MDKFPTADSVDIMLLLEGTFPYVSGGVSSWVNQIIRGFPEYRFGAVFLGSRQDEYEGFRYELPDNLVHLETSFMYGHGSSPKIRSIKGSESTMKIVRELHEWFRKPDPDTLQSELKDVGFYREGGDGVDFSSFLYSEGAWEMISDLYRERCNDPSFVDYFWTVRNMHRPIWQLANIADNLIPARLYHSVSTGYAGFLGALLHYNTGRPLLLSEHGIYTKERRIDLFHAEWIKDNRNAFQKDATEVSYYRELWIRFFETLGRFCYGAAGTIVSLYEGARERQIADGAVQELTTVVPNGIDVAKFAPLRSKRPDKPPQVLALLGRVVPIKDVKTYIRALRIVTNHLPDVQGWIVGPWDESPGYVAECKALAESLQVSESIIFKGFMNPVDLFPLTGLLVMSSISEGLPLVLLEAFAAGVPAVVTDVGACRQIIEGFGEEDVNIGSAGGVVDINNPQTLADQILRLMTDENEWQAAQKASMARVEKYYSQHMMFSRYREFYVKGVA